MIFPMPAVKMKRMICNRQLCLGRPLPPDEELDELELEEAPPAFMYTTGAG